MMMLVREAKDRALVAAGALAAMAVYFLVAVGTLALVTLIMVTMIMPLAFPIVVAVLVTAATRERYQVSARLGQPSALPA
jgi:hypothetical protein